ncbi:LacI family DNA-binding transcriptional regulator, partial [Collinsella aerofaciens]
MAQQTRNGHSASAAEVAALAGVSRQTVSRVVNGMP